MAGIWENLQLLPIGTLILLPGIVWLRCEAKFLVPAKVDQIERAFTYALYSLFAYTICYFVFRSEFTEVFAKREISTSLAIRAAVLLVITAVVGGTLTGMSRTNDLIGKCFAKFGIQTVHPIESAWVAAFSRKRGCLIRLTFKDGTNRFGVWGTKSLVSCTGINEDIFLEQVWCEDPDGNLVPEVGTQGMWVRQDEISCIRFHELEELDNEQAKQTCQQSAQDKWFGGPSARSGTRTLVIQGSSGRPASNARDEGAEPFSESPDAVNADRESLGTIEVKPPQVSRSA